MPDANLPQFWHITWPVMQNGSYVFREDMGRDEADARARARVWSKGSRATVTNREGLVATYVDGREVHYDRP